MKKKIQNWKVFVRQRFNPAAYLPAIIIFVAAQYSFQAVVMPGSLNASMVQLLLIALATLVFFFLLRLYDDVKDQRFDTHIHPERPLPQKIVHEKELRSAAWLSIAFVFVAFGSLGKEPAFAIVLTILYSLLMFKEFLLGEWLRQRLVLYAVTHTFVIFLLSVCILSAVTKIGFFDFANVIYIYALATWLAFNTFEFARKTFATKEEREGLPSYSKSLGRLGAFALATITSGGAVLLVSLSLQAVRWGVAILSIPLALFLIAGLTYVGSNKAVYAKAYRLVGESFPTLLYLTVVAFGFLYIS